LPQHGFARNTRWEFLSKSTSEGTGGGVKLDFALSSDGLDEAVRALWPHAFSLLYSVTLEPKSLTTSLVITNQGDEPFEFQTLLHTYFRVKNIEAVEVAGLEGAEYIDKVDALKVKSQPGAVTFTGETDRIYTPTKGPDAPLTISEAGTPLFSIVRENLENAVVFNPWVDKAKSTADFEPKDGWKNMVCVEPGTVTGWQTLDSNDAYEAAQTITLH
jgi:glucose-6-phosphate 1-epimerase